MPIARGIMTINRFSLFNTSTTLSVTEVSPYYCGETIHLVAQVSNSGFGSIVPTGGTISIIDANSQTVLASGAPDSNGQLSYSTVLPGGTISIIASYSGSSHPVFYPSTSSILVISAPAISTNTTITSTLPSTINCTITNTPITVSVAPFGIFASPNIGTVAIVGIQGTNVVTLASATPVNGLISTNIPTSAFTNLGSWSIQAQYLAAGCYASSSSAGVPSAPVIQVTLDVTTTAISALPSTVNCTVTSIPITVTVTSNPNPSVGAVVVTATQGSTQVTLISATPNNGIVSANVPTSDFTNIGSWSIQAEYLATGCYTSSYSSVSTVQLIQDPTNTSISSVSSTAFCQNSSVTVNVNVSATALPSPSTGTITLYGYHNGTPINIVYGTPVTGNASIVIPANIFPSVGTWYIQASYSDGSCYAASSSLGGSNGYAITVFNYTNNVTSTVLTLPTSGVVGSSVHVVAYVNSTYASAVGTVSFYSGTSGGNLSQVASATIIGGYATADISGSYFTTPGIFYLQAVYTGSACFGVSASNVLSTHIIQGNTSVEITSTLPLLIICTDTNIPVTVQVSSTNLAPPSIGTVTLIASVGSNTVILATATPTNGIVNTSFSFSNFPSLARWDIYASYSDGITYSSSTSSSYEISVTQATTSTSIVAVSSTLFCQTSSVGVTITVSATALANPTTGTISLYAYNDGTIIHIGNAVPTNGTAAITIAPMTLTPVGTWFLQAQYTDGSCYANSSSPDGSSGYPITVYDYSNNLTSMSFVVPAQNAISPIGAELYVDVTVNSTYTPTTGTVSFWGGYDRNNINLLASTTIVSGYAGVNIPGSVFNMQGTFYLQAIYSSTSSCIGSAHTPSGSGALSISITQSSTTTSITSYVPPVIRCNNADIQVNIQVTSSLLPAPSVGTVGLIAVQESNVYAFGAITPTNGLATITINVGGFTAISGIGSNHAWSIQAQYSDNATNAPYAASSNAPSAPSMYVTGDATTTTIASINGYTSSSIACTGNTFTVVVHVSATSLSAPSIGTVTVYGIYNGNSSVIGTGTPTNGVASILCSFYPSTSTGPWFVQAAYDSGAVCYLDSSSLPPGSSGTVVQAYNNTNNITHLNWQGPASSLVNNTLSVGVQFVNQYSSPIGELVYFYGGYNFASNFLGTANVNGGSIASITLPGSTFNMLGPFYFQVVYNGSPCCSSATTGPISTSGPVVNIVSH